jgi:type IV pilus assembly protein PilZ
MPLPGPHRAGSDPHVPPADESQLPQPVGLDASRSDPVDRRSSERFEVTWSVDCETEDTFLYASIMNISELGIFVRTTEPLAVGTTMTLRFAPPDSKAAFVLRGAVQWINVVRPLQDNPNPGMGIRFVEITAQDRERLVETIRTIAYLRDNEPSN